MGAYVAQRVLLNWQYEVIRFEHACNKLCEVIALCTAPMANHNLGKLYSYEKSERERNITKH